MGRKSEAIVRHKATSIKRAPSQAKVAALSKGVAHLAKADPTLAGIIDQVGRQCSISIRSDPFRSLVEAIIYQQLAGSAADAIAGRFLKIYGGSKFPLPSQILGTEPSLLRTAGLSGRKIEYIFDLASRIVDGRLDFAMVSAADDEAVIEHLIQVKGIGRWTAEMFLIFCLGRMNVLPVGDLGLRKAIQLNYGLESLPNPDTIKKIARPWNPYSTIATWYLWKSLAKFKTIG